MPTYEELKQAAEEAEQKSYVMIEFPAPGIAEFRIFKNNVTPAQVLGALSILELQVKNWYVQEENRRQQEEAARQLSVPTQKIQIAKP